MLVRPHNRGIDGMFLVGGRPKARQRLEYRIPHPELAPAGEAHEGRVPLAVSVGQVAPRRARAQHPENAVHRSPLVRNGRTTLAPIRQQRIENAPFRVRQISPTHGCPPSRKAALNHSPMKKPSTRPSRRSELDQSSRRDSVSGLADTPLFRYCAPLDERSRTKSWATKTRRSSRRACAAR